MKDEITVNELSQKNGDEYLIVDIRDKSAFDYGHISGAINIPSAEIENADLPENKEIYVCCHSGKLSYDVAEDLRGKGYKAFNLKGGYIAWLRSHITDNVDGERARNVEESLRKKFHKEIFSKFAKAVSTYQLIQPNDKIAVCISGGKDSFLMAKLFQELQRHNKYPFELVFLVMDPGYSKPNREIIENNAKLLNVPLTIFETNIFDSVFNIEKSPCYICARMRRGNLYAKAQELGCNKIALGHHYDDVIETILMGMLYGGQVQTMMPRLKSANFEGMELIRPMYLIREDDVKAWRDYNELCFIQCACRFTDTCSTCGGSSGSSNTGSKRAKVKSIIRKLKEEDPEIEQNIFKSVENVSLSTIIAYKDKDGTRHNFLEDFEN
jgi:tRNA(Ile)-lysidine synthase TilS/MesJ/rhodanese-related sulfurtransferase